MPSAGRRRPAAEHDRVLSGRVVRRAERAHDRVPLRRRAGLLGRHVVHRAGRGREAGAARGLHGRGRDQPPAMMRTAHDNILSL